MYNTIYYIISWEKSWEKSGGPGQKILEEILGEFPSNKWPRTKSPRNFIEFGGGLAVIILKRGPNLQKLLFGQGKVISSCFIH